MTITMSPRYYLDHAATSHPKPPEVWEAFLHQAREIGAPAGRSGYREAVESERAVENARRTLARFLGGVPERVVFTLNATDALNIAIKGTLRPDDHVVTTVMEHNSVTRPLRKLENERGIRVTRVPVSASGVVDPSAIEAAFEKSTRLVVMAHASNVTGTIQPVSQVSALTRERGIVFLVDAAQTAGTLPIHLENDGIDLLAVPGHKGLLGPPGTGALLLREGIELESFREGGTGFRGTEALQPTEYPWRLEAGSPNTPGIAGLAAGVKAIEGQGLERIQERLHGLMKTFQGGVAELPGLTLFGSSNIEKREPVYSINLSGHSPEELATLLDAQFGVQVRSGLHCAPGCHEAMGSFPAGTCRFSMGSMSRVEDVEAGVEALREIAGA